MGGRGCACASPRMKKLSEQQPPFGSPVMIPRLSCRSQVHTISQICVIISKFSAGKLLLRIALFTVSRPLVHFPSPTFQLLNSENSSGSFQSNRQAAVATLTLRKMSSLSEASTLSPSSVSTSIASTSVATTVIGKVLVTVILQLHISLLFA